MKVRVFFPRYKDHYFDIECDSIKVIQDSRQLMEIGEEENAEITLVPNRRLIRIRPTTFSMVMDKLQEVTEQQKV